MTISLKLATQREVPEVLHLCQKLFRESAYEKVVQWEDDSVIARILQIVNGKPEDGCIILLVKDEQTVGLLAASYIFQMFNTSHKTAVELAYYIDVEHRTPAAHKLLMKAYRFWARKIGCHSVLMGKLKNKDEVETYTIRRL